MLARAVLAGLLLSCASLVAADTPSSNSTASDIDVAPTGRAAEAEDEDEAVGPSLPPSPGDEDEEFGGAGGVGPGEEDEDEAKGGGDHGGGSAKWPRCQLETGNDTQSLLGILSGSYTDRFGEATFFNLLQKVDAPTLRVLKDFNVSRRGYTLVVPRNRATNFSDPNLPVRPLFSLYGIDPVFISSRKATRIVRNHIIPQTLTYFELEKLTESGTPVRYESLGQAVWEFEFFTSEGAVDGSVVLTDTYNVTQERADDVLYMQWDISNSKPGECPNAVFTVDGLLATPDTVDPPELEMAPGPAPFVAPPPIGPREIVRAATGGNVALDDDSPAPAPALSPLGLVDDDRREALAANTRSGCPGLIPQGAHMFALGAFTVAVALLGV